MRTIVSLSFSNVAPGLLNFIAALGFNENDETGECSSRLEFLRRFNEASVKFSMLDKLSYWINSKLIIFDYFDM